MAIISNEDLPKVADCWRAECRARAAADAALSPSTADYNRDDVADAIRGIARTLDYNRSAAENITKGRLYALADKTALDMAGAPAVEFSLYLKAPQLIDRLASKIQSLERALERERDDYRKLAMARCSQ